MRKINHRQVKSLGLIIAIVGTIIAIILAIIPHFGGTYSPLLGVLTATLITIIWYTYFTFLVVQREDSTFIVVNFSTNLETDGLHLYPFIKNYSKRKVIAKVFLEIQWDGQKRILIDFYNGKDDFEIDPYLEFTGHIPPPFSRAIKGFRPMPKNELLVKFNVQWQDDLGYKGETGFKYWRMKIRGTTNILVQIVEPSIITELFTDRG